MSKEMKTLFAYDGSECADEALQNLQQSGLPSSGELLVLSVADVFIPQGMADDEQFPQVVPEAVTRARVRSLEALSEAERLARQARDQIQQKFPGWQVQFEAKADSPAWAVIKKADEWKPDLIVMGARGISAFGGRLILGSISQRVLYEARCSVRIARSTPDPAIRPVRILIGVDSSSDSRAAVTSVCQRNWPPGSEVALLAVVDSVMEVPDDSSDSSTTKWIEVSAEESWDTLRKLFEPEAQKLRGAGLHAEVLIRRGKPADEIVEEAQTWGADCIFLGARGTRGIDRLLLGSVSSAVAARAHCSVEVVRPKT
jgi:nucleotide-binding universal stress UspA family protein